MLGCEVEKDGSGEYVLGVRTKERLTTGFVFLKTLKNTMKKGIIVVAATRLPQFPDMEMTMASLMKEWLLEAGCTEDEIVELNAESLNTRGELKAFIQYVQDVQERNNDVAWLNIASEALHLKRARTILGRMYGRQIAGSCMYLRTYPEENSLRNSFLEFCKRIYVWCPEQWRDWVLRQFKKMDSNPSW